VTGRELKGIGLAAALMAFAAPSFAQDPGSAVSVFEEANRLYEAGEYEEAIASYTALVERGAVDADLYYNLGNAYYKTGTIGPAMLFYERAARLAPRDEDIAENRRLVRSLVRDRQFVATPGVVQRMLSWLPDRLTTRELVGLSVGLYLLFMSIAIVFVLRERRWVSRMYGTLSLLSPGRLLGLEKTGDFLLAMLLVFVLFAVTAGTTASRYRTELQRSEAVVMEEEVPVYSGPSTDATLQFKIHAGTIVRVTEARPRWVEIELPGELSGWIRSDVSERI
jgi:tetratricopeptide (TPR) repeat protein